MTMGILLQIPFFAAFYFILDENSKQTIPSFSEEQTIYQWAMYGIMIGTSFVVGYAQVATEFACKKYVYQCTWKERKAQAFVRRIDNIPPIAGGLGLAFSGLYYQFYQGDNLA